MRELPLTLSSGKEAVLTIPRHWKRNLQALSFWMLCIFVRGSRAYGETNFAFPIGQGIIARNDKVSYFDGAISASLAIYIMTFGGQFVFFGLVTIAMIVVGLMFANRLQFQKGEETSEPTQAQLGKVGALSIASLGAFVVFTWILNVIYYTSSSQSLTITTWFGNFAFNTSTAWSGTYTAGFIAIVIVIPAAEEQFFRGLWGNAATSFLGPIFGAFAGGAVFAMFHIAVYGLNQLVLATVLVDGATIIVINAVSGSLYTGIIAHRLNNLFSFVLQGSIVGSVLGPFHGFGLIVLSTLVLLYITKKREDRGVCTKG